MKWIYLHIFILILVLSNFSQEQRRFNFGIKTGAVLSSFWGNGVDNFEESMSEGVRDFDADMMLSLTVAGLISYDFIPGFFNVQGELQYLRLGKNWEIDLESGEEVSFGLYTDYLSIPVLFKLLIPLNSSVLPAVYAGSSLFIQLRSRARNLELVPTSLQGEFLQGLGNRKNVSNQVSNFDVGFHTGLSLSFRTKPGSIVLDFRFAFGAINVFTVEGGEDFRNSFFSIMVGYVFR
jgi:hypothetical protein